MITAIVSTAVYLKPELLLDANGDAVTTKVNGEWAKTARLLGTATTATPAITHVAGGVYDISVTFSAIGYWSVEYSVTVDGETVFFDPVLVRVITAAQADPAAALSGVSVVTVSPIDTSNDRITLVRGDAYLNADGRAVAFTVTSPSLVGATATLVFRTYAGVEALSKAMTISGTTVRVDLTSVETAALTTGTPIYKYEVVATLSGGSTATLAQGVVWVQD
ncbi:MAG: hypothetical protein IT337_09340 [Thermomicrobiales bacterium]|nr:hypothetical protein [Thermomicrobiales bacterium]